MKNFIKNTMKFEYNLEFNGWFDIVTGKLIIHDVDSYGDAQEEVFVAKLSDMIADELKEEDFPNIQSLADKDEYDIAELKKSRDLLDKLIDCIEALPDE